MTVKGPTFRDLLHFYNTFNVHKDEFTDEVIRKIKTLVQIIYKIEGKSENIPANFDELYVRLFLFQIRDAEGEEKLIHYHLNLEGCPEEMAKRIVKCYKEKNPTLDLSGLNILIQELPPCIKELTHIRTLNL